MVGILIATHGGFAEGLLSAVELIAGKQEKVETVGLYHGDGVDEFEGKITAAMDKLDDGDGVLIFVDILGGTPSNTVMRCFSKKDNIKAIAGMNMAMVVQAVMMRDGMDLDSLCAECVEVGNQPPILLHDMYADMIKQQSQETEEDEI